MQYSEGEHILQALHNQFLSDKPLYVTKMSQIRSLTGHLPFFSRDLRRRRIGLDVFYGFATENLTKTII